MSAHPTTPSPGLVPRRTVLVAAGVLPALTLLVGCSGEATGGADAVTPAQVDRLAAQVRVQQDLVAAYATAFAASPELAVAAAVLADQARDQLTRLQAAAPSVTGSAAEPSSSGPPSASTAPADPRATLRAQVGAAADSHATACLDFAGGRAALLGSIAAGLRGQDGQLA